MKQAANLFSIMLCCCACMFFSYASDAQQTSTDKKQYRFYRSITVDGRTRTFLVNLPPNYYLTSGFSLVIAMHGGGGDAYQFERTSLLTDKANAAKFIVVYPEGVKSNKLLHARTWNAGECCDYAVDHNINDVKFIGILIDTLLADYKINRRKVYATGHSNGGMMSYRLASEIPEKIAAIAANGCTMVTTQPCNPSRPVPVLHMHSVLDKNVPYTGGVGTGPGAGVDYHSVDSTLTVWAQVDACNTTPEVVRDDTAYKFTRWYDCANNVAVEYYLTQDGGHAWPGGLKGSAMGDKPSKVINANNLLWNFFKRFQLPAGTAVTSPQAAQTPAGTAEY